MFGWVGNLFSKIPELIRQPNDKVTVSIQLNTGEQPIFPDKEDFAVTKDPRARYYSTHGGIKYLRYPNDSSLVTYVWGPVVEITETSCAIVPAGKKIRFKTNLPPRFVFNMVDGIRFKLDTKKIPEKDQDLFMKQGFSLSGKVSWQEINANWDKVNTEFLITTKAEKAKDIPPPHLGGLVCF